MKKIIFLLLILAFVYATAAFSQQEGVHKVTGSVVDENGQALPGVTIVVKGTSAGTITNGNGNYTFPKISTTETLVFSFVGMQNQEVSVGNKDVINVALRESATGLNEVMVVGYGTQKKMDITGSLSQIDTKQMADMPVQNIGQQLQGKIAGVQINENTGDPGAAMAIRIRGAASVNAGNAPLIVIDGFPTETGLESLSPDEIESISVLKDASSAALYGSRAANGVILVTTKQAKEGQKSIEFSSYTGIQSVSQRGRPDLMNAPEFAEYKKEYYEDAATYEGYTGGVPAVYQNPAQYAPNSGTNWFNVLLRTGLSQNYNLSFSSGGKYLKSVVNFNYNKDLGVVINSHSDRYTLRTNNVYKATDNLTIGANLSLIYQTSNIYPYLGNGRNALGNAFNMDPTINYKNADGTYPLSFSQPGMFGNPNWYLVLQQSEFPTTSSTEVANAFAEYEIIKGLKYKISFNANINNTINRDFVPSTAAGWLGDPIDRAWGDYGTSSFLTYLAENTLTYQKNN